MRTFSKVQEEALACGMSGALVKGVRLCPKDGEQALVKGLCQVVS